MQVDQDAHARPAQQPAQHRPRHRQGDPAGDQADALHADLKPRGVKPSPGGAGRGGDAADVRVAPGEHRLHERRLGDLPGARLRLPGRPSPDHVHRHALGGAFPVLHEPLGQATGHRLEHRRKRLAAAAAGADGRTRCPAGQREDGVVRAHVAVDADAAEGPSRHVAEQPRQQPRGDPGIGGKHAQHRRHRRRDHPRALGHAAHADQAPRDARLHGRFLGVQVGRQDRLGGRLMVAAAQLPRKRRQRPLHLGDRQPGPDEAGRGNEHVALGDAKLGCRGAGDPPRVAQPGRARQAVGAAAVDEDRLRAASAEPLPADEDRGSLHAVGRKHAGCGDRTSSRHQRHVRLAAALDPRVDPRRGEPRRGGHPSRHPLHQTNSEFGIRNSE